MLVNWIPYMPAMKCSTRPLFLWQCTDNYLAPEVFSRQEILKQVIVNGRAKVTLKTLKIITIVTCSWFPSNFAPIQGCLTSRKMLKIRWDWWSSFSMDIEMQSFLILGRACTTSRTGLDPVQMLPAKTGFWLLHNLQVQCNLKHQKLLPAFIRQICLCML